MYQLANQRRAVCPAWACADPIPKGWQLSDRLHR